jgi:gluconokinase
MVVLLMGVSGSGKTTVGRLLAAQLGWEFADADDYHSAENVKKMQCGIPLTDVDRARWLETLRIGISEWIAAGKNGVLACSALKRAYRDILVVDPAVRVVYLKGSPELLHERLHARLDHFMTEQMLGSQLATLEEPKDVIVVEVDQSVAKIVHEISRRLEPKCGTAD